MTSTAVATDTAKYLPVQQLRESLCPVPLNDSLATVQLYKFIQILGKLSYRLLKANITSVNDVDAVAHGVCNVLCHETPKACNKYKIINISVTEHPTDQQS